MRRRPCCVARTSPCALARFMRLTNAFSKQIENLKAAVAVHFAHDNFVRIRSKARTSSAMAAGVTDRLWILEELVGRTPK